MKITVVCTCMVAFAVIGEVTALTEKELERESQRQSLINIFHESRVGMQTRKRACRNFGGRCVRNNKDCPNGFPYETKAGGPYCNKQRRCCYQGCVYGFKAYPDNAIVKQGCYELKCEMGYWKIKGDECQETCSGHNFFVTVRTGDGLNAGTNANVHIMFEDHNGKSTEKFTISDSSRGHLQRGGNDEHRVPISKGFGKTASLKIALENSERSVIDWFCEHILVEDPRNNVTSIFPIHQRIGSNHTFELEDFETCSVSKTCPGPSLKEEYQFTTKLTAAMVKTLPWDEYFSISYGAEFLAEGAALAAKKAIHSEVWKVTGDINKIYFESYPLPESFSHWTEDMWFGLQRVQGILPNIIELCSQIPEKLGVTEDTVKGLLEGLTLQEALKNYKIFITDLHILDGIEFKNNTNLNHASPIALFYLNKINQLMPIAIQLWQMKGPNNPIYTAKDEGNTWLVAKMYYNNAEAQVHEIVHHLSYTHLIMDGIATSMNRQLVSSHPVYRLLKPHFRFMMQINKLAEIAISSPGGSLDLFSIGTEGVGRLVERAVPLFNFTRAIGSVESDARARGVWDKQVLPDYLFRDDAATIYNITKKYVTTVLTDCYDTPELVVEDQCLQNYHAELVKPRDQGGVGINGLPGSNVTGFSNIDEVIDMVTTFIVQCSVGHATVNFPQYETYGYMPNYPADMTAPPPHQKVNYTKDEMMKLLPDVPIWLDVMLITKFLSWDGTNELGDYVKEYCTDPICDKALTDFRNDLKDFSEIVKKRNAEREYPYKYLDPEYVPNAISI